MDYNEIYYDKKIENKIDEFKRKQKSNNLESRDFMNLFDCLNLYAKKYNVDKNLWFNIKDKLLSIDFYYENFVTPGTVLLDTLTIIKQLEVLTKAYQLKWQRDFSPLVIGICINLHATSQVEIDEYEHEKKRFNIYNTFLNDMKSIIVASTLLKLTDEEAACLTYYNHLYDSDIEELMKHYPNVFYVHYAYEYAKFQNFLETNHK